jgi:hypothetical protein
MRYRNVTSHCCSSLPSWSRPGLYISGRRPGCRTRYLAHIYLGSCGEEEGGGQGHSNHEHGTAMEIEYPLCPVEPDKKGKGRARRWCTRLLSKACSRETPCTSTYTPRLRGATAGDVREPE